MINIEVITDFTDFKKMKSPWNELEESSKSEDMVFLTHAWFDCWWQSYSKNCNLFIIVAKDANKIVGIAPLMIRKILFRGIPVRLLSFIDNGNSAHNNFIIDSSNRYEILETIINYLMRKKYKWDILELKRIPPESENFQMLRKALSSNYILWAEKEGTKAPYLKINSSWQCFSDNLSRKTKKTLRNVQNRLERQGDYYIHLITDFKEYERKKLHLYDIANNSWAQDIRNSLSSPKNRLFFEKLSEVAGRNKWLQVWMLYLNEDPIAFEYHLIYKGRLHGLRSSFKRSYSNLSPGAFLDYQIVKNIFSDEKISEYDMGGNLDFYKKRWTKDYRGHIAFDIFAEHFYSRLIYAYEYRLISILKRVLGR